MLKLWGDGRGVMGGDGEKCGVAVLGIWGSRKWVAGERGTPSEIRGGDGEHGMPNVIREARGCVAPADARRDSRRPWMHGAQSTQHDSQQLKYALWWLLV